MGLGATSDYAWLTGLHSKHQNISTAWSYMAVLKDFITCQLPKIPALQLNVTADLLQRTMITVIFEYLRTISNGPYITDFDIPANIIMVHYLYFPIW